MPQTIQIVPKYNHSHVETIINDNSLVSGQSSSVVSDNLLDYICVFLSGEGVDNKFVTKENRSEFVSMFGDSNYKKYGQPIMNALALLDAGRARVHCMRVMPEDAAYANSVLSVYYKADIPNKKFLIKFGAKSLNGIVNKKTFFSTAPTVALDGALTGGEHVTAEGYTQKPIMGVIAAGRGAYGNQLRWRNASNAAYEKDYGYKIYTFETLSAKSGLTKIAAYVGSITPIASVDKTIFINDLLDDVTPGVNPTELQIFEDNMDDLYAAYVEFLNDVMDANVGLTIAIPTIEKFDPFFGLLTGTTVADPYLTVSATPFALNNVTGNVLAGGTEGAFDAVSPEAYETAVVAAYTKAFDGTYDKTVLSSRRIPAVVLLDANYPYAVKEKLIALALLRDDAMLYIDAGIIPSLSTAVLDSLEDEYDFDTNKLSKEIQHYYVKESTTKKKVPVTTTYYLASKITNHILENGIHVPFVKNYAVLSGHVKNSLTPSIELHESDLKERLDTMRFNFYECIAEDTFQRASQSTSQSETSDLLEENNMRTLFLLKRELETLANSNGYNFTSNEDRKTFQRVATSKFATWIGVRVASLEIKYESNVWESERMIVHCYASVTFRAMSKQTIVEIDINKRTAGEATTTSGVISY